MTEIEPPSRQRIDEPFREVKCNSSAELPRRGPNALASNGVSELGGSLVQTEGLFVGHAQVTVQRASLTELRALAPWYRYVDPLLPSEPDDMHNGGRGDALRPEILGAALDVHDDTAIKKKFDQVATAGAPDTVLVRHLLARTLVLSARVGSATVGVLKMGPASQLHQKTMGQLEQSRADARTIMTTHMNLAARVSKLELVSVVPELRHRGIGSALVIEALRIAQASGIKQVFGQFGASHPLARFYTRLGFTVKNQGATLRLVGGYDIQPPPTDQLFHTRCDCGTDRSGEHRQYAKKVPHPTTPNRGEASPLTERRSWDRK